MMAKKVLLSHSSSESFSIFGISCHLREYRLTWLINQAAGVHLSRKDDFVKQSSKPQENRAFSLYHYHDEATAITLHLLANRNAQGVLFPSLKQADYLMIVQGAMPTPKKLDLLECLRNINDVLAVFPVEAQSLPEWDLFVSDLEMHLLGSGK
ncbi:MAG: IPExxxVDY family protein [Bacteroidetes bacterium]|nr:IPExxxVDY family protein [Bacteroidota bacterium]